VIAAGQPNPACGSCHPTDSRGRISRPPGHRACFTACHAPTPPPLPRRRNTPYAAAADPARTALCATCHLAQALAAAAAGRARQLPALANDAPLEPDFVLALAHASHVGPQADDCLGCHARSATRRARPHERCIRCHSAATSSVQPPITECGRCHQSGDNAGPGPGLRRGRYPVTKTFSHARHAPHTPETRAGPCTSVCHGDVPRATGSLRAPDKAACAPCHDGKRAFSMRSAQCRRCHGPEVGQPRDASVKTPYSHPRHRDRGIDLPCASCHQLDRHYQTRPGAAGHVPCANDGCHAADFAAKTPRTCGACHIGSEPWRPLHAEAAPPQQAEFAVRFSHRQHLGNAVTQARCTGCHRRERDHRLARPDHRACVGGDCHQNDRGTPPMSDCDACHQSASARPPPGPAGADRWSVRARFRHRTHPSRCESCHRLPGPSAPDALPRPGKAQCAPCHNGDVAFKMTGHSCARCHGRS
jgi:hypothetical protein